MRSKTYRRFITEFKLGVVEAYLAGEGSIKGLATKAGVDRSLVHYWLKKYHAGELSLDLHREEQLVETDQHIAALDGIIHRSLMPKGFGANMVGKRSFAFSDTSEASAHDVQRGAVLAHSSVRIARRWKQYVCHRHNVVARSTRRRLP